MESHVIILIFIKISIINLEQPKLCLARKIARLMPLSTNATLEMEKLKKQASKFHQKLNGYTFGGSVGSPIPTKFSTLFSPGAARTDLRSADGDFP